MDYSPGRLDALEARLAQVEATVSRLSDADAPSQVIAPPPPRHRPVEQPAPPGPLSSTSRPPAAKPAPSNDPVDNLPLTEAVFKWGGVTLVTLAAGFFVSTAISRGWLGPLAQWSAVMLAGGALATAALRLQHRRAWALALGHSAIITLALAILAGDDPLDVYGRPVAATLGALLLAWGVWFALRLARSSLAAMTAAATTTLAVAGLPIGDRPGIVMVVLAGTWLIMVVVARLQLWASLRLSSLLIIAPPMVVLAGLQGEVNDTSGTVAAVVASLIGLGVIVWGLTDRGAECDGNEVTQVIDVRIGLVAAPLTWLMMGLATVRGADAPFWLALVIAAGVALGTEALARTTRLADASRWALLAGSLALVTIAAVGLISGTTSLLLALAVQAAALAALAVSTRDKLLGLQAIVMVGAVLMITLARLYTALWVQPTLGAAAVHLAIIAAVAMVGLLLTNRVVSIAAWSAWMLWLVGALVHLQQGQMLVSLAWAIGALALVWWGLIVDRRRLTTARVGVISLAVTVGKLMTIDLQTVDPLWRAGLFFVVGVGLLRLGYLVSGFNDTDGDDELVGSGVDGGDTHVVAHG